jgi:GDP-L-fucose synthase
LKTTDTIYVAGAKTLIGAAIARKLSEQGFTNIIGEDEPDLTNANAVDQYFGERKPNYVFLAAGKSGGIEANRYYPATLMLDNLLVECHVIQSAFQAGVQRLLYLASSCSYPKYCNQPMSVESLMSGSLETTNEAYAVAKIAGIKLCQAYKQQYGVNYIVGIPGNAFGPNDDFDLENAHVIPALIHRMHKAKEMNQKTVTVWGTGTPRREFVFSDELADACVFVMEAYDGLEPINLGSGKDFSIAELAEYVKDTVGYRGQIEYDHTRPDGMPLKALDSNPLLKVGWQPDIDFNTALSITYKWFLEHYCSPE